MFRKAQAAMEFLMTYGWALLAVLVVIGALAYLGILDVETILPERCTFPVPLNCQDHVVNSETVQLVLLNGAGRGMNVRSIIAESEAFPAETSGDENYKCIWTPLSSSGTGTHGGTHLLRNGQSETFTLRWSVPQDTTFALETVTSGTPAVTVDNVGVYRTATTITSIAVLVPGTTTTPTTSAAVAAGILTPSAAAATVTSTQNCFYNDVGRGKNRYAITVFYTWSDSRSILHRVGGELFSSSPE